MAPVMLIEGLAVLGRYDEAARREVVVERAVERGLVCTIAGRLCRTAAGIAAAAASNWARAEEHHLMAIQQADSGVFVAQPPARAWFAEMLLMRNAAGDRSRARSLLSEAVGRAEALAMPLQARRIGERLAALSS